MPVVRLTPHTTGSLWALAIAAFLLGAGGLFASCDSGDKTLVEVDPAAVPFAPDFEHARAILERHCVPCHQDGESENDEDENEDEREFEEDDPDYSTCEGIQAGAGDLLRVITEDTMPPGAWPRLTEEDKLILLNWFLNSGACSPCTEPCS